MGTRNTERIDNAATMPSLPGWKIMDDLAKRATAWSHLPIAEIDRKTRIEVAMELQIHCIARKDEQIPAQQRQQLLKRVVRAATYLFQEEVRLPQPFTDFLWNQSGRNPASLEQLFADIMDWKACPCPCGTHAEIVNMGDAPANPTSALIGMLTGMFGDVLMDEIGSNPMDTPPSPAGLNGMAAGPSSSRPGFRRMFP